MTIVTRSIKQENNGHLEKQGKNLMLASLSVGAIGAAVIAAIISLFGLVVTKEQKISEFRQQWIDSLRTEITDYLTSINAISDALGVTYVNQGEKVKALSQLYSALNRAHFMITLRLNPEERYAAEVLLCMKELAQLAADESSFVDQVGRKSIEERFLIVSKMLLKYEWKRVKRGEISFVAAKYVTILVTVAASILLVLSYLTLTPSKDFWSDLSTYSIPDASKRFLEIISSF